MRRLTNGVGVLAAVTFGAPSFAQANGEASPSGAAPAAPPARFMIRAFQVIGNHLLPTGDVEDVVYRFMGPDRTAADVERARSALQSAFEQRGYATVAVTIPEQGVDTGIIRLEVTPQTIGKVTVAGTRKPDAILRRAPSLTAGAVPNFKAVQADVVALNQVANRKVTPEVKAGAAAGTIDVALNVEETSAFHGSVELNNYRSPSTSDLRVAASLRYDDLWGRGDSISVSAQIPPRRTGDGTVISGSYTARLGRLQLVNYYVHSDSDIGIVGGTSVVGRGNLAGTRLIVPLKQGDGFYQSLTLGLDYKNFEESVRLGADRSTAPIEYVPVTAGWRGDWTRETFRAFGSISATLGIRGLGDDRGAFDTKRFQARPNFFYLRGEGGTTIDTWRDFQAYAHLSYQYSDEPLISNEEFSVGGIDTVRGYEESETLGDYGVAYQFELRSPRLFAGVKAFDEARLLAFVDTGYSGIHRALPGQEGSVLSSVGGGLRVKIRRYWNGSLDAGVPLRDGPATRAGDPFAKFRIWGEF